MAFRRELIKEHRAWLRSHLAKHPKCYDNWNRLYKQDKESALHEAVVRRYFVSEDYEIEPNETGKSKAPDFRCTTPKGKTFYVEATCILAAKVAEKTHLPNTSGRRGARHYTPLTQRLSFVPRNKLAQCEKANAPVLVAVGTFHIDSPLLFAESKLTFCLTGCQYITWDIDTTTGRAVGKKPQLTTSHEGASFFNEQGQLECSPVSGLLYFKSSYEDVLTHGILHPHPTHKFDPTWLKCVSFGSIDPTSLRTSWTKSNKDDPKRRYAKMRKAGWTEAEITKWKKEATAFKRGLEKALRKNVTKLKKK